MSFTTDAWVQNTGGLKLLSLSSKGFLQGGGSGLMETYMQDQLVFGHGFSISDLRHGNKLAHYIFRSEPCTEPSCAYLTKGYFRGDLI